MKKTVLVLTAFLILGLIIAVLFSNKAKMEEKAKKTSFISYPVSVAIVKKQVLQDILSQVGVIGANNDLTIISETQGKAIAVMVKVGSYVTAGTPIIQVDNELQKAKYLAVKINYENARKDIERFEALHKEGLISNSQYDSARTLYNAAEAEYIAAKRQYNNSTITAPIAGIITACPVNIGTMIAPGVPVANIVDISKLKVKLNIAEQDAFRLRVGDSVEVETDVYPDLKFHGRIESISVKGDEAHTYPVEISIPNNKEHPLKAGMFGRVTFTTNMLNNVLAVPREVLLGSIKSPQLYVIKNGRAKLRKIVVGRESGTKLEVLQGLMEGEMIVTNGQDNLKDNVEVNIVEQR